VRKHTYILLGILVVVIACAGCNRWAGGGNRTEKSEKSRTESQIFDSTRKDKITIKTEKPATKKQPIKVTYEDKNQNVTREIHCPAGSTVTVTADNRLIMNKNTSESSSSDVVEKIKKSRMKWLFVAGFFGIVAGVILLKYSPIIGIGAIVGSIAGTAAMHYIDTYDYIAGPAIILVIIGFLAYLIITKRAHFLTDRAATTMVRRIENGTPKETLNGEASQDSEITKDIVRKIKKREHIT